MYKSNFFDLEPLVLSDAQSLSELMVSKEDYFEWYFPNTLAKNGTHKSAKASILKKEKEHRLKKEFTYAIRVKHRIAGLIILKKIDWNLNEGELAYYMGSNFEGRCWTTHCTKIVVQHALEGLGFKTLNISVHKGNLRGLKGG